MQSRSCSLPRACLVLFSIFFEQLVDELLTNHDRYKRKPHGLSKDLQSCTRWWRACIGERPLVIKISCGLIISLSRRLLCIYMLPQPQLQPQADSACNAHQRKERSGNPTSPGRWRSNGLRWIVNLVLTPGRTRLCAVLRLPTANKRSLASLLLADSKVIRFGLCK